MKWQVKVRGFHHIHIYWVEAEGAIQAEEIIKKYKMDEQLSNRQPLYPKAIFAMESRLITVPTVIIGQENREYEEPKQSACDRVEEDRS